MADRQPLRVLVVDDDALTTDLVTRALSAESFEVAVASCAEEVPAVARTFQPHAVLVDVNIPGVGSGGAVQVARSAAPAGARIFLFSSDDDGALRAIARRVNADGWVSKSLAVVELGARIRALLATMNSS